MVITGGPATGLTYQPDPNYCNSPPGATPDTFTYTLTGGSTATVSVTVTCVPAPVTLVNSAGRSPTPRTIPATAVDGGVAITNPDDITITDGSVSITDDFQSGQDILAWSTTTAGDGITEGTSTAPTVVLTGSGTATAIRRRPRRGDVRQHQREPVDGDPDRHLHRHRRRRGLGHDRRSLSPPSTTHRWPSTTPRPCIEDAAATAVTVLTNDTDIDGTGPRRSPP